MIDLTFSNVHRLFVLSFMFGRNVPKDFNELIDNKSFFDQTVKTKQKSCKKTTEMSRNDDCTTGNVLDYLLSSKML